MMEVPAVCPRCSRLTSWSPRRVWCVNCNFSMEAKKGESTQALIRRWNKAVVDGEGYVELVRENGQREHMKRVIGSGYSGRHETERTFRHEA